ncbi:M16 family metallopeptidase [Desulfococcus sp.]|uniref:M16 family metallopeptidase n=1 Tax=Desulfococcus sp. TaxID=2025834 RepID=UPI00359435DE
MVLNKTTLANGIRILTQTLPHYRSVSMGVWVNVGARDETADESGLSHFIEHMIFKGTRRRTAFQIAKEFDAIGGYTNAYTTPETTCYHAKVMDAHIETMVDILSDIFLNSVFDDDEMERERLVIAQEIGMIEDSPEEYVHVLSETAFWGDHPLGRPISGSRENVLRIDADALKRFFLRLYQPERIVVSAAGSVDHDRLVAILEPKFGAVEKGNGFPERQTTRGRSGLFVHPRDLGQLHICLGTGGLSITDPRRYAASLLSTVLGGNMSSRLFQKIREQRGLAYSVYSFFSSYVDTGMSGIYLGTDPENGPEAVALIIDELNAFKETPVDPGELSDAKEYTRSNLIMATESVDNQMVRIAQNEIHFGEDLPLPEIISHVDKVTCEDIMTLSREIFRPDPLALTLLGPVPDQTPYENLAGVTA